MGWLGTIATLLIAVTMGLWARAGGARPAEPGRVRYVPYTMILFASTLVVTLMIGQLLKLAMSP